MCRAQWRRSHVPTTQKRTASLSSSLSFREYNLAFLAVIALAYPLNEVFLAGGTVSHKRVPPGRRNVFEPRLAAGDPWKAMVFKYPRKKPPRELKTENDVFAAQMRERMDALKQKKLQNTEEVRSVKEDKIDDLIAKEVENAQLDVRYTLWRMDKATDKIRQEEENPDLDTVRRKYQQRLQDLNDATTNRKRVVINSAKNQDGYLERSVDIDEVVARHASQSKLKAASLQATPLEAIGSVSVEDEEAEKQSSIAYLTQLQKRSSREDKMSRRVKKSPEQRRQEYEASKVTMFAATGSVGILGSLAGYLCFGVNEAVGFAFGTTAALQYLSGLASYTDNAESPMGASQGGRRFLAPVLLVLLVEGWPKIEARVPAIEDLHLQPALPAAILGFLLYNVGTVASRVFLPTSSASESPSDKT